MWGEDMANLSGLIAPSFYQVHQSINKNEYTHYWLKGGRGSTKSSFISLEIILGVMKDPLANAVIFRKVGENLKNSVFEQLLWAIDVLGVSQYWRNKLSPLELVYTVTGQRIVFRGADNPKKIKSIKFKHGYVKFAWYEEVDEFAGMEEIRNINQSLMRGGEKYCIFYSFNPPKSQQSWVNGEMLDQRDDKLVHHSTYLTVPREWLGNQFFTEAEELKEKKPEAYRHEYMGEVTGTGGQVFANVTVREITDEEICTFGYVNRGLDWGYSIDPLHYVVDSYNRKKRKLYIFFELNGVGMSNRKLAEHIKVENKNNDLIMCDSAEPKSIAELHSYGIKIMGYKKFADSVDYGIKWLQDLEEIIIDPIRCPATAKEFLGYELESDNNGGFKARFPDKNNHSIDAVRYSVVFMPEHKEKKPPKKANFKCEEPKKNPLGVGTKKTII